MINNDQYNRLPRYNQCLAQPSHNNTQLTLQEVLDLPDNKSNCYKLKTFAFGLQVQFDKVNQENAELGKEMDELALAHTDAISRLKAEHNDELNILKATHMEEADELKGMLENTNVFNGYDEMKALLESQVEDRDRTIEVLANVITDLEERLDRMTSIARGAEDMCKELVEYVVRS